MSKKKEEQLAQAQKTAEVARQAAAPQSGYSTADLNSRSDVQNALAGAEYRPSQNVTDAANDLKQWQQNRPGQYQSAYQDKMDELMDALLGRDSFQYSYVQDPLYRQYAQLYTQNAANASGRCRRAGGSPDGRLWLQLCGQRGTAGLPAADRGPE